MRGSEFFEALLKGGAIRTDIGDGMWLLIDGDIVFLMSEDEDWFVVGGRYGIGD